MSELYDLARLLRSAAVGALHYLMHGDASAELAARETEFHHGDDPIEADLEAQRHFEQAARDHEEFDHLRIISIVGEERIEAVPAREPGDRVVVVDPLDGSTPWSLARLGYCVAALVLRAIDSSRYTVDCALIATPSETFTYLRPGLVLHGPLAGRPETDLIIGSVVPESEFLPRSVAAVAYKPADRALAEPILAHLPDWSFVTLGGNPVMPYVLTGRLTASVTLKPASTWDSVGVLMASVTDAVVGTHAGQPVSGPDFELLFAQVLVTGNVEAIPPLIVAKSKGAFEELVSAIGKAGEA